MTIPPFQALLDAHGRDVHRFLTATVGRSDADDCYQDTWLAALRAYPRLHDARNLRSWIFTVAHRKAIDHANARRRRAIPVAELPEGRAASGHPLPGPAVAGGPAADPTAADGRPELWEQVRRLPPKQRTAIALRFIADAAHAEIAQVMGISEEAARRNVHEGLKRLRTEYDHDRD